MQVPGVPRPLEGPSDWVHRGIGGSTRCLTRGALGSGIYGYNGQISSVCQDQDAPMLMSKADMNTLGFHIHLPNEGPETVGIVALGIRRAPACTVWRGHLVISIVDYETDAHPGVVSSMSRWQEQGAPVNVDHDNFRDDDDTIDEVYAQLRTARQHIDWFVDDEKYYDSEPPTTYALCESAVEHRDGLV